MMMSSFKCWLNDKKKINCLSRSNSNNHNLYFNFVTYEFYFILFYFYYLFYLFNVLVKSTTISRFVKTKIRNTFVNNNTF